MVKTKTPLDQTQLNAVKKTPYLDIESDVEPDTKAGVLKAKAVVMIDPLTGKALGASDFFFEMQADAAISQANPVSTTLYEVLPTTKNVRLISIAANITWAVTQPTPLEVVVTIDGISTLFVIGNPVSASTYTAALNAIGAANDQLLSTVLAYERYRSFLLEGRSVRVQARITWAVTQPTPLVCRVKYAKR